jgi:hypothetical protein
VGRAWEIVRKETWDWPIWPGSKDVGGLGKYNYEEERKHGTGHYDHAKMWEGLGNAIMRRKGSMGLSNMTMQRCGKACEIQL